MAMVAVCVELPGYDGPEGPDEEGQDDAAAASGPPSGEPTLEARLNAMAVALGAPDVSDPGMDGQVGKGLSEDPDYAPDQPAPAGASGGGRAAVKKAPSRKAPARRSGQSQSVEVTMEELDDVSGRAPVRAKRQRISAHASKNAAAFVEALDARENRPSHVRFRQASLWYTTCVPAAL